MAHHSFKDTTKALDYYLTHLHLLKQCLNELPGNYLRDYEIPFLQDYWKMMARLNPKKAEEDINALLDIPDMPELAMFYSFKARCHFLLNNPQKAVELSRKAFILARKYEQPLEPILLDITRAHR